MGFFDPLGIIDHSVDTIENAADFTANMVTFQFGDAMVSLADQQIVMGLDVTVGDVAKEIDGFLDDNPWLKTVIIAAAGAATGGTGALVAAAALTATDALAKAEDGEYSWTDFKGTAMEGASNFSTAVTAGGAGLATRAAQMQFASQVLSQMTAETELAPYINVATGAATMDWSTTMNAVQNVSEIVASVAEVQGEEDVARLLRLAADASGDGIANIGEGVTLTADALAVSGVIEEEQAALISGFVAVGEDGYSLEEGGEAATALAAELGLVDADTAARVRAGIASSSDGLSEADFVSITASAAVELEVIDDQDAAQISAAASMASDGLTPQEAAMLANLALHEAGVYGHSVAATVESGIEAMPGGGDLEFEEVLGVSLRSLAESGVLSEEAAAAIGLGANVVADGAATLDDMARLIEIADLPPTARAALLTISSQVGEAGR